MRPVSSELKRVGLCIDWTSSKFSAYNESLYRKRHCALITCVYFTSAVESLGPSSFSEGHVIFVYCRISWMKSLMWFAMCIALSLKEINTPLRFFSFHVNPLNPELNPICYLLALLGAHHFLHVSRIRVKLLTFTRLMSYIYIYQ